MGSLHAQDVALGKLSLLLLKSCDAFRHMIPREYCERVYPQPLLVAAFICCDELHVSVAHRSIHSRLTRAAPRPNGKPEPLNSG